MGAQVATYTGVRQTARTALATMIAIPLVAYFLYFSVAFNDGALLPGPDADWQAFSRSVVPTVEAALVYLAWLILQAALFIVLPGRVVDGLPLEGGARLRYKLNGRLAILVSLAIVGLGHVSGVFPLSWIYDNFGALLTVITIFSFAFAWFVYWWGIRRPGGPSVVSGNILIDYFFGTALNPRIPPMTGFDLKFFFESRPGLIGWAVVVIGLATAQLERDGQLSLAMALVVGMQVLYVASYFWWERGVLSMIDIRTERFGWMLVYGDAALVPMTYSIQAYYLIDHVSDLAPWFAAVIVALFAVGHFIFRSANAQKDRFRRDPDNCRIWGRPAEYIETARGTPLLVSGFWGLARHMNYLGDWLMALSFSLPTLFGSVVTYFYPIFLGSLLISRQQRDDRWCAEKYGDDWARYCRRVPARIVPGLY
jgi:hypothetical protein